MPIRISCACGKELTARDELAGKTARCPACGAVITLPEKAALRIAKEELARINDSSRPVSSSPAEIMRANRRIAGKTCPICRNEIKLGEEVRNCLACDLPHHATCWAQNGGCSTYGCRNGPQNGSQPAIQRSWTSQDEEQVRKLKQEVASAKRRNRRMVAAGGVTLACLVVLLAWWMCRPRPRSVKDSAVEAVKTSAVETVKDSAVETVRAYLAAATWRGRLPYVLDPERVRPFMEAHYSKGWKQYDFQILTQDEPKAGEGDCVEVEANILGRLTVYYLKKTKAGYRIDWESSAGFNPTSVAEFHATKPTTPVKFRALAKLDSYYNYEFRGADDIYWSIKIEDSGGETIGHGYAMKNKPYGDQLFKVVRDGAVHHVVLDLVYPPDAQSPRDFLISNVYCLDSWQLADTGR